MFNRLDSDKESNLADEELAIMFLQRNMDKETCMICGRAEDWIFATPETKGS